MSKDTGIGLEAVQIPISRDIAVLISSAGSRQPDEGMESVPGLPSGWMARIVNGKSEKGAIRFFPSAAKEGRHGLVLYEIQRYFWTVLVSGSPVNAALLKVQSSLKEHRSTEWSQKILKDTLFGDFRVINYLGSAWLRVGSRTELIEFDVISKKLDFEGEYRRIVQAIAEHCQQLLLEWGSPTSLRIAVDPAKERRLLLEQFLFLRNFLGSEKLDYYLEAIQRNAHSALEVERRWLPVGLGSPDEFFTNPMAYGRDWISKVGNSPFPWQISSSRKYETNDTPPNQFIKFAIESFVELCNEVIERLGDGKSRGTAVLEATEMRDKLDAFLLSSFFKGVGRMRALPLQSQTLQKREGYKQLLQAWILLDAASTLDWPGREDAYDGTNRDVATFYEFWLFFELRKILKGINGLEELVQDRQKHPDKVLNFARKTNDGLHISLRQGKESICRFSYSENGQKFSIHLYYNRTFSARSSGIGQAGSYSRPLRPDYSLVIFPYEFTESNSTPSKAEAKAEGQGQITYLHFDAKFRADSLEQLFGTKQKPDSAQSEQDTDAFLDTEKGESAALSVYKRGDLYKMHTYNDAIRRTAGSYVLFPGSHDDTGDRFARLHEILPGVGAFAIRPSNGDLPTKGAEAIKSFLIDVLSVQKDKFSQFHRAKYWANEIVKEEPGNYIANNFDIPEALPPADTPVLLGFVRSKKTSQVIRGLGIFYFHAIGKNGYPAKIDPAVFRAKVLIPYRKYTAVGWSANIDGTELVTRGELVSSLGVHAGILKSENTHYYRLKLSNICELPKIKLGHVVPHRPGKPLVKSLDAIFIDPEQ